MLLAVKKRKLTLLGFLDPSSESEDLKSGTKVELPLWLAQPLNVAKESIVSVDIPKTYKEGYRYNVQAHTVCETICKAIR